MIANYHTHTVRCHHAFGTDEDYVKAAIRQGLRTLGFSDHTPQFYERGFVNEAKMLPSEMDGYVESLLSLREAYKNDIDIRIGFEVEYYPSLWDELLAAYRRYPIDYLILGQHHVEPETDPTSFCTFDATEDPTHLRRFFDTEIAALDTGRFTYLAHPDVLRFVGDEALYRTECRRLIERAKETNTPLEINLVGIRYGRHYPNPLFWEEVARIGAPVVIGCDAHSPAQVANAEELRRAEDFARSFGLCPLEDISLIDPLF